MLKLTYMDAGLHIEAIAQSLETVVAQRVMLSLQAGQTLHVEPGSASFLLPQHIPGLGDVLTTLGAAGRGLFTLSVVDDTYLEVTLTGQWIASHDAALEGIFLVALPAVVERLLYRTWVASQSVVSVP
ncbi:alr0857 family protein [Leptolyngbya sp. AN02str]|uniref:alr0857 family protein n=1 Tax=Leptolyngbya sp. AN02str TaxID=3423363 RepID=UPI003D311048